MGIHAIRWAAVLGLVPLAYAAVPPPDAWVPARWPFADARSLELLDGSPINCLLLSQPARELAAAAAQRGLVTLAVLQPSPDVAAAARQAIAAKITGLVLEGDFPDDAAAS